MILERRSLESWLGLASIFCGAWLCAVTVVVVGVMSGMGTLKVADGLGDVIVVVGGATVAVGTVMVCCGGGGGGGGDEGGR